MTDGRVEPIEVLRAYWVNRVATACEYASTRQRIEAWLAAIPAAALATEVQVLRAAIADPRTASIALDHLARHLLDRAPGLPAPVRAALISKIARADLTEAPFVDLLERLAEADDDTRARLVVELLTPTEAPSLAGVHAVLAHGLRAVPFRVWPAPPYHGGATRPDIGARNYEVAARSLAGWFEDEADGALSQRLHAAADKERALATGRPDNSGTSLRPHVKAVARALVDQGREARCTEFLRAIDDELLRLDTVNALARYNKEASAPIVRTLWRGMMGKRVVAWVAELPGDVFGLLCRLPFHYQWIEGSRDDVLATVPVDHFEDAVTTVLER